MKIQCSKGEFEKSKDLNNLQFKAMLKDLTKYKGKLIRNGWFYWTFKDDSTVDRQMGRNYLHECRVGF
ncbi:MAG: hypothetical protein ACKD6O_02340 [Candidatus Bathyarchaeota archaeon]